MPKHQVAAGRDVWDERALGVARGRLPHVAKRFLVARHDSALGLAPTKLLPRGPAEAWLLFWCAARRVDDSVERGETSVQDWREALREGSEQTLASRCVQALLAHPSIEDPGGTQRILEMGLRGLDREKQFLRPRSMREYLDLLRFKSEPAMLLLDRLLFPDEREGLRRRHARLFAASTQLGDDCRDVVQDLRNRRCFVTKEEVRNRPVRQHARSATFWKERSAMCAEFLARSQTVALRFASTQGRMGASRLAEFWSYAIRTHQIRPTDSPLRLPPAGGAPVRRSPFFTH